MGMRSADGTSVAVGVRVSVWVCVGVKVIVAVGSGEGVRVGRALGNGVPVAGGVGVSVDNGMGAPPHPAASKKENTPKRLAKLKDLGRCRRERGGTFPGFSSTIEL